MKRQQRTGKLFGLVDNWFTDPEANAAGRMALFRILYCLFYLWHLSYHSAERLSAFPKEHWSPMILVDWIPKDLPPLFFQGLEAVLVAALLLLLVGLKVRLVTGVVLVSGSTLEALYVSVVGDHSMVFLAFYIPFFMLLNNRWGRVYSLDAVLRQRAGEPRVDPLDSSWQYFLPARCSLVILLVLFTSAGLLKAFAGGTWIEQPDLLANIMLEKNIKCATLGLPLNPFAPFIAEHPFLYNFLRFQTVVAESSFVVALLSRRLCRIYLLYALVFHSINALWLVVTFTPVLVVYLMFVDWQSLLGRVSGTLRRPPIYLPAPLLVGAVLVLSVLLGISWNLGTTMRDLFNLGGALNWRTIWYPVLPLALILLSRELLSVMQAARSQLLQRDERTVAACSPLPPGTQ